MKKILKILGITAFILTTLFLLFMEGVFYITSNSYKAEAHQASHPIVGTYHESFKVECLEPQPDKARLFFWYTSCPASKAAIKKVKALASKYENQLEIAIITSSEDPLIGEDDPDNIVQCTGRNKVFADKFQHHDSSHFILLNQDSELMAYDHGSHISEYDTVLSLMTKNMSLPESINSLILDKDHSFQTNLKNRQSTDFRITGYDSAQHRTDGRSSFTYIDFKNSSIYDHYRSSHWLPAYRVIDQSSRNLSNDSEENLYCIYYKIDEPYKPLILQMLFADDEERHQNFLSQLRPKLDEAFGLKSSLINQETGLLILTDIEKTASNGLKVSEIDDNPKYQYGEDSTVTGLSFRGRSVNLVNELQNDYFPESTVVCEVDKSEKIEIHLTLLNPRESTLEERIKGLEKQGLIFEHERKKLDFLILEDDEKIFDQATASISY